MKFLYFLCVCIALFINGIVIENLSKRNQKQIQLLLLNITHKTRTIIILIIIRIIVIPGIEY